jgi:hypothetical protein
MRSAVHVQGLGWIGPDASLPRTESPSQAKRGRLARVYQPSLLNASLPVWPVSRPGSRPAPPTSRSEALRPRLVDRLSDFYRVVYGSREMY